MSSLLPTIANQSAPAESAPPEPITRHRSASSEERLFLLLSIFIGVLSALVVVLFRMAIEWLTLLLQGSAPAPHQLRLLLVPAGVGIVLGLTIRYVFPDVRGSGVNQTKAALYIHNGYVSTKTMIGKFLLASLSIGSGQSLGPEDPSLHYGAGVASRVGRFMGLSRDRMRLFAPVGAAAGLAAAFNAPISAVLLVIEEVIGQWTAAILGSIVLAAVSAVVVARWFWGSEPMFRIPPVTLRDPRELLAYAALGVVGGFASLALTKALAWLRPRLRRQPANLQVFFPALAGLFVGTTAYFGFPEVLGTGYGAIDAALHGQYTLQILLLLAVLKLLASTVSFSAGAPGGMFATAFFLGAMLGAAVGTFEHIFFPTIVGPVGSYALVGMGVFFAAFIRVPLTSVFMILEISGNYSVILPVVLANTLAYLISRSLQPVPILELFTHQDGLYLPSMEEEREDAQLRFEDALRSTAVPVLLGSEKVRELHEHSQQADEVAAAAGVLIQCTNGWYAAAHEEVQQWIDDASSEDDRTLEACAGLERTPLLFPDQPLYQALPYFRRWPLLPVSNRAMRGVLEGVLTQDDVLRRYHEPTAAR